jgi:hypothetical protein
MAVCPYCAETAPDGLSKCPTCQTEIFKDCAFCAETIPSISKVCPDCKSDLTRAIGEPALPPAQIQALRSRTLGEERGVLVTLLLGMVTFGVYGFVVLYQQAQEIKNHGADARLNPSRDITLGIISWICSAGMMPVWLYYIMYRYPKALTETCIQEEIPCRDIMTPCLLLTIVVTSSAMILLAFPPFFFLAGLIPVWVIAVALFQHELNTHWHVHQELR